MGCTSSRDTTRSTTVPESDAFERRYRRYPSRRRIPLSHIPPSNRLHSARYRIRGRSLNGNDPAQVSSFYYRNHLADLEAFSQRYQQHILQGSQSNVDLEIRQLQSDLDTLERLFQALLGHGFMDHLVQAPEEGQDVLTNSSCPPASKDVIDNLACIQIAEEDLVEECNRDCCICFYEHNVGDVQVARLPCGHLFHQRCIRDWLAKKCTCPICRYELPSDNEVFEQGRAERMKERTLRVRRHELSRLSVQELQQMMETDQIQDRSELMKLLQDSDRVEILDAAPLESPVCREDGWKSQDPLQTLDAVSEYPLLQSQHPQVQQHQPQDTKNSCHLERIQEKISE